MEVSSWVSECVTRAPDTVLSTGVITHLQAALLETASNSVYFKTAYSLLTSQKTGELEGH